jgi:hypothetical protein
MTGETVAGSREAGEKITNPADTAVSTDAASPWLEPYRWRPGESGNRGGRAGRLAQRVRQATGDGADLVTFLVGVVNDTSERTRDRLHAAEMLLSRGWGKALQPVALKALLESRTEERAAVDTGFLATLDVSPETARALLAIFKRMTGRDRDLPAPGLKP